MFFHQLQQITLTKLLWWLCEPLLDDQATNVDHLSHCKLWNQLIVETDPRHYIRVASVKYLYTLEWKDFFSDSEFDAWTEKLCILSQRTQIMTSNKIVKSALDTIEIVWSFYCWGDWRMISSIMPWFWLCKPFIHQLRCKILILPHSSKGVNNTTKVKSAWVLRRLGPWVSKIAW